MGYAILACFKNITLDDDITMDETAAPFLLLRLTGIAELATVFYRDRYLVTVHNVEITGYSDTSYTVQ